MEQYDVLSKLNGFSSIMGDGIKVGEDMVKVDSILTEEVEPFWLRELRNSSVAVE
jgi:hypothetical protein